MERDTITEEPPVLPPVVTACLAQLRELLRGQKYRHKGTSVMAVRLDRRLGEINKLLQAGDNRETFLARWDTCDLTMGHIELCFPRSRKPLATRSTALALTRQLRMEVREFAYDDS